MSSSEIRTNKKERKRQQELTLQEKIERFLKNGLRKPEKFTFRGLHHRFSLAQKKAKKLVKECRKLAENQLSWKNTLRCNEMFHAEQAIQDINETLEKMSFEIRQREEEEKKIEQDLLSCCDFGLTDTNPIDLTTEPPFDFTVETGDGSPLKFRWNDLDPSNCDFSMFLK